ncbi:Uncharacterised protein [Pandoraea pulmonicola]|uniref:Uncharacterized protein n=1 Tax=Pandoraea pulmonicola TaxID=93221 RepID=A0AAJ4ZHL7_PANPU|nr:Uncharacterised protein [Pandoraea pulmonicola]
MMNFSHPHAQALHVVPMGQPVAFVKNKKQSLN